MNKKHLFLAWLFRPRHNHLDVWIFLLFGMLLYNDHFFLAFALITIGLAISSWGGSKLQWVIHTQIKLGDQSKEVGR